MPTRSPAPSWLFLIALTALATLSVPACSSKSSSGGGGGAATANDTGTENGAGTAPVVAPAATGSGTTVTGDTTLGTGTTAVAGTTVAGTVGGATSFQLTCDNGALYVGNYADNATMCANLQARVATCPTQGAALYAQLCGAGATTAGGTSVATPAPASSPVVTALPGGGTQITTTTSSSGTNTSYVLNCQNGSIFSGNYPDHSSMCLALGQHVATCPTQGQALYSQLCP